MCIGFLNKKLCKVLLIINVLSGFYCALAVHGLCRVDADAQSCILAQTRLIIDVFLMEKVRGGWLFNRVLGCCWELGNSATTG